MKVLPLFLLSLAGAACVASAEVAVGQGTAAYEKGIALLEDKDSKERLALARGAFEEAANQGHADAAVRLGTMFANGSGGPRDEARALEWFTKAAASGSREGLYNKGLFLVEGRGAPQDAGQGLSALEASAAGGCMPAHIKLADLYYFGAPWLQKDHSRALPHVEAAAASADAWACNILGTMAERGQAMKADLSAARHWFTKAAEQNDAKAQCNLGRLLRSGKPGDHDKVRAYVWLKLASLQGNSMATYQLTAHAVTLNPVQVAQANREIEQFRKARAASGEGTRTNATK